MAKQLWQCMTTESRTGEQIDTTVPYHFLHETASTEWVIERADGQIYMGESRWIVSRGNMRKWEEQAHIQLAIELGVSDIVGKRLHEAIWRYNLAVQALEKDMNAVLAAARPFMNEAYIKETAIIQDKIIAGSHLDKLFTQHLLTMKCSLTSLSEREGAEAVSSLIGKQKEEFPHAKREETK